MTDVIPSDAGPLTPDNPPLGHNEDTLFKVRRGFQSAGIYNDQLITAVISGMSNEGIFFRETVK